MKIEMLGVAPELLDKVGAVSKGVAEAMAVGARHRTKSTYALSVTGVAGPATGAETAPVGTTFISVADDTGTEVLERQFLGDRTRIRNFASQVALDMLRRRIKSRT